MPDATMTPWRRPNEIIFVDPTWAVADGDHTLVELSHPQDPDGPSLYIIRRFVGRRIADATVNLLRWDAGKPTTDVLPAQRVLRLLRILEWDEATAT